MGKILTISIAAYNVEAYLEQCLDSLLIPSMDKLEVLIENDGSKDNTAAIGKRYEEKYPGTFRLVNKENGGYGSTINNSIRLATGKYFKQLDGDDWYHTEHLEALICQLETVDADCVFTPFLMIYEPDGKQVLHGKPEQATGLYPLEDVVDTDMFPHMHALAFRTELLRNHDITILEHCFYTDTEYVIYPLLHTKNVFVYDHYIYCYRMGREGQSVSMDGWRKHYREHERVIFQILTHYEAVLRCPTKVNDRLMQRIHALINLQNNLYMVLGDKKAEMKAFDQRLCSEYPEFFHVRKAHEGKRIKLLRLSGFLLYPLLRKKSL